MTTEEAMGLAGTGIREAYLEQDIREELLKPFGRGRPFS